MQKEIYEMVGIDRSTYIRYENPEFEDHNIDTLKNICNVIGIDPNLVYDEYLAFLDSNYGTRINNFINKNKLSIKSFGEFISIHPKNVSKWKKEVASPSRESYGKIKKIFFEYGQAI